MNRNEIFRSYGTDFLPMTKRLLEAAGLEEELERRCRELSVPRERLRVAVKPNLLDCTPADYGATTHPEIVSGIIEFLQEKGCPEITIMEGSWVGAKTKDAFEYCGYNALAAKYGVKIIDCQKEKSFRGDCAGMELNICSCVREADFLITVPVLKGHCQTKVTCALKNLKGLLPNSEKRRFHSMGLHAPIAHLNSYIRQDFIVIDHICGDPDFEEGGSPLVRNCIMAAKDPVLADAYAASLLGYEPRDVEYIRLAEKLGVGSADLSRLVPVTLEGENPEDAPVRHRLLDVSYAVGDVDSCSACYASLAAALCRLKEEGLLEGFGGRICIGQGWRGRTGAVGTGNCTKDFDFFIPGCPPSEEEVYAALKERLTERAQARRLSSCYGS